MQYAKWIVGMAISILFTPSLHAGGPECRIAGRVLMTPEFSKEEVHHMPLGGRNVLYLRFVNHPPKEGDLSTMTAKGGVTLRLKFGEPFEEKIPCDATLLIGGKVDTGNARIVGGNFGPGRVVPHMEGPAPRILLTGIQKLELKPGSTVYIGTLIYHRDSDGNIDDLKVKDEYDAFTAKERGTMIRALAKITTTPQVDKRKS